MPKTSIQNYSNVLKKQFIIEVLRTRQAKDQSKYSESSESW